MLLCLQRVEKNASWMPNFGFTIGVYVNIKQLSSLKTTGMISLKTTGMIRLGYLFGAVSLELVAGPVLSN